MEVMPTNYLAIISSIFIGLAAGYLGSFMVIRRMSLVGDALSHVALPGVAAGILLHFNPFIGAFGTLFVGIIAIWLIEKKSRLSTESLVGLFFTVSLAIGLLLIPDEKVIEALFGDLSTISHLDLIFTVLLSLIVIIISMKIAKGLILSTLSEDLAQSSNVKSGAINFVFLLMIAIIVALGIKVVGTLLMGALVIIPAITAKNISSNLHSYTWGSAIMGLVSALSGVVIADIFSLSPGPSVVIASGTLFLVSLLFVKK